MSIVILDNIGKRFPGAKEWAVRNFSMQIEQGEIVALLGESGCGKTTLLRMISGFEVPSEGTITVNGKVVASEKSFVEPRLRNVGIVFQDYALFPHKTVWENILFGLFRFPRKTADEKAKKVIELSALGGLEERYPHELSGGQKQRVALARALAPEPGIILFDEPFSNLDTNRKNQMREDIAAIIRKSQTTAVFVTHDTRDVLALADRVAILQQGVCLQQGKPEIIYHQPVNPYVANFFGKTNIIKGKVKKDHIETVLGKFIPDSDVLSGLSENDDVLVSIRPEDIEIKEQNIPGSYEGTIITDRFMGEYREITCRLVVKTSSDNSPDIVFCAPHHCQFKDNRCHFAIQQSKNFGIMKL